MPEKIIYDKNRNPKSILRDDGSVVPYSNPTDAGAIEPDLDRTEEIAEEDKKIEDMNTEETLDLLNDNIKKDESGKLDNIDSYTKRDNSTDDYICSEKSSKIINKSLLDDDVNRPSSNGVFEEYGQAIVLSTIALLIFAIVPKKDQ